MVILNAIQILLNRFNMKQILLAICTLVLFTPVANAQKVQKSPKSTLTQTVGTTDIQVVYSRPGLKGRTLESLTPSGQVWRTGANEATTVSFSKPVKIGGKELAAGNYSLYTIPSEAVWTIIINSKQSWGTNYSEDKDVLRFTVQAIKVNEATETFTINISDIANDGTKANLELRWGNIIVKAPIEVTL